MREIVIPNVEWGALWPVWIASVTTLLVMLADLVVPKEQKRLLAWLGCVGLVAAIVSAFTVMDSAPNAFLGMIAADDTARIMAAVIFGTAAACIVLSPDYLYRRGIRETAGEYYALILACAVGMWLLANAVNFMLVFLAIELLSLALYILAGFVPANLKSHESGFKYFLLSSFASAFLLYGIALMYGATGSTGYATIRAFLTTHTLSGTNAYLTLLALGLIVVGFAFKVSAVPFHMWTPDVYEGAPTPVTALMAVGTKVAIIGAFIRLFPGALLSLAAQWLPLLWALAILTMIGGNILAVSQSNVKRMLAYSAVAHAGYLLVGIVSAVRLPVWGGMNNPMATMTANTSAISAILFYLIAYAVTTLGAFAVVVALERNDGEGGNLSDYAGLGRRRPLLAAALVICLLSLGGIPPFAGFFGKALIFGAAFQSNHGELAIIGVLTSVVAVFYYLRIVVAMYTGEPDTARVRSVNVGLPLATATGVLALGVVLLGVLAGVPLNWVQTAVGSLAR